jgi:diadenosine tetraphosphate (Ap4A) HIT family hydrolase
LNLEDARRRAFRLSEEHRAAFWLDVCSVARAVRDAVGASKINYEIHNTVAHLTCTSSPASQRSLHGQAGRWSERSPAELRELAVAIQMALERLPDG